MRQAIEIYNRTEYFYFINCMLLKKVEYNVYMPLTWLINIFSDTSFVIGSKFALSLQFESGRGESSISTQQILQSKLTLGFNISLESSKSHESCSKRLFRTFNYFGQRNKY